VLIKVGLTWFSFIFFIFSNLIPGTKRIWYGLLMLSSPLLIVSGIRLFSFKKAARKLALFSYGIVLLNAFIINVFGYVLALKLSGTGRNTNPYHLANIKAYFGTDVWSIPIIFLLMPLFFICILFFSKEQFNDKNKTI